MGILRKSLPYLMRRLDRYLLSEILVPALVGGVLVLILLVGNQLYGLLRYLYNGVPLREVALALAYFVPGVLMMAIPASLLLGVALGINRLEQDRELLAMRMAGSRLKRIVFPLVALGIIASGVMFYLQEKVIPYTTHEALKLTTKLQYGYTAAVIPSDTVLRVDAQGKSFFIYVKQASSTKDKQTLRGVMVAQLNPGKYPDWMTIPLAESQGGEWKLLPDPQTGENPRMYNFNGLGYTADALDGSWTLPMEKLAYAYEGKNTPEELTLRELLLLKSGVRGATGYGMSNGIVLAPQQLTFYIHRKIAAPLAALVAILFAIPLAVHFGRSGGYVGLLLSVLVSFFFVITQQWMQALADYSRIQPILAAWIPNASFGILGIILLFREE